MYEVTFILDQEDSSLVRKILEKHKAEIISGGELKKIRLSYPVKKQPYGFLGTFKVKVDPEAVNELSFDLKAMSNILRYMLSKVKEKEVKIEEKRKGVGELALKEKVKRPEPVLTNEELEKKIEEILK